MPSKHVDRREWAVVPPIAQAHRHDRHTHALATLRLAHLSHCPYIDMKRNALKFHDACATAVRAPKLACEGWDKRLQ